ncbi:hypothetical protein, partial [Undibacterium sp.]|uniref:hypothetical protein n=1 Tax=Undibacterium sp. TaxID=1914977 RepID=UPI002B7ADC8F
PNAGKNQAEPSGLAYLASYCQPPDYRYRSKEVADSNWNKCLGELPAQATFLVAHGADVNGRAGVENACVTPYDVAKNNGNPMLMATLLELKADPDFGAKCRKSSR